jgi:hypothetical protein
MAVLQFNTNQQTTELCNQPNGCFTLEEGTNKQTKEPTCTRTSPFAIFPPVTRHFEAALGLWPTLMALVAKHVWCAQEVAVRPRALHRKVTGQKPRILSTPNTPAQHNTATTHTKHTRTTPHGNSTRQSVRNRMATVHATP